MPQTPSGGGSIVAPGLPKPSLRMSTNALRSSASTIARRSSGLSYGGLCGLISIVRGTLAALTSLTFSYQDLRGLRRSLSLPLSINRSQVHLTSAAVNGLPSCHLTPWCKGKVSSLPSSLQLHPVASSGTIELRLFCATC